MQKIAVIATKGGVGKTLTTIHLACEAERRGLDTAIIDLDPQCSATRWSDWRSSQSPAVASIQSQRLGRTLKVSEQAGAQIVLIDTAPHASQAAIAAAEVANLILIPCRPEILDLSAISDTARIVKLVQKQAFVVLSAAPHRAPRIEQDAANAIREYGLDLAPIVIHRRSALSHSLVTGQGICEFEPAGKGAEEIAELFSWICGKLGMFK